MKTNKSTSKNATIATVLCTIVVVLLSASSAFSQRRSTPFYMGFEGSFGARTFTVTSNIAEINNLNVLQEGGKVGIIFGSQFSRTRIGLAGFYYSSSSTERTVDLYEGDLSTNIYPLSILNPMSRKRVEPYFTSGIIYSRVKFFGDYMSEDQGKMNYSDPREPMVGMINQVRAAIGTGLTWKLMDNYDFVHLFAEAKYGFNIAAGESNQNLSNTSLSNQLTFNIGVQVGRIGGRR